MKNGIFNKIGMVGAVAAVSLLFPSCNDEEKTVSDTTKAGLKMEQNVSKESVLPEWLPVDKNGNFDEKKALENCDKMKLYDKMDDLRDVAKDSQDGFEKKHQDQIAEILFGKGTPLAEEAKNIPLDEIKAEMEQLKSLDKEISLADVLTVVLAGAAGVGFVLLGHSQVKPKNPIITQIGIIAIGLVVLGQIYDSLESQRETMDAVNGRPGIQVLVSTQKKIVEAYKNKPEVQSSLKKQKTNQRLNDKMIIDNMQRSH